MTIPSVNTAYSDPTTERNTVLLAECQKPENMAKNRALCRANGIESGTNELRRLHHFVSQSIIKLLSKHNITQKDGRPYVSSSPKGFLQGPDMWLVDKGYYLSGWPHGLPRGSISIWAAHYTFALAAMFISETITLQPLAHSMQNKQQAAATAKPRVDPKPSSSSPARATTQPVGASEERCGSGLGSDQDADGSSDQGFESESEHEPHVPVPATAAAFKEPKAPYPPLAPSYPSLQLLHLPQTFRLPEGLASTSSAHIAESAGSSAAGSTKISLPADLRINSVNLPPLEKTTLGVVDNARKRKVFDGPIPEVLYPGVPSGATVNWVPPVSAARETKKARKD